MDLSQYDYLQIDKDSIKVEHSESYIHQNKGKKHKRKIFDNVEYHPYEQEKLELVQKQLQQEKIVLPKYWKESDTLKYLYTGNFKVDKTVTQIKEAIQIKNQMKNKSQIQPQSQQLLEQGVFYIAGRDYQFRPIAVIDVPKIDTKNNSEEVLIESISVLLYIVQQKMFIPGIIENWVIIIEVGGRGLTGIPLNLISKIISVLSKNFNGCLDKLYLTNPSSSLKFMWGTIAAFLDDDTKEKIQFIKSKKEFVLMQQQIPSSQLEQRFLGNLNNIEQFFPPQNTLKHINFQELKQNNQLLNGVKESDDQESWNIIENQIKIQNNDNIDYEDDMRNTMSTVYHDLNNENNFSKKNSIASDSFHKNPQFKSFEQQCGNHESQYKSFNNNNNQEGNYEEIIQKYKQESIIYEDERETQISYMSKSKSNIKAKNEKESSCTKCIIF